MLRWMQHLGWSLQRLQLLSVLMRELRSLRRTLSPFLWSGQVSNQPPYWGTTFRPAFPEFSQDVAGAADELSGHSFTDLEGSRQHNLERVVMRRVRGRVHRAQ